VHRTSDLTAAEAKGAPCIHLRGYSWIAEETAEADTRSYGRNLTRHGAHAAAIIGQCCWITPGSHEKECVPSAPYSPPCRLYAGTLVFGAAHKNRRAYMFSSVEVRMSSCSFVTACCTALKAGAHADMLAPLLLPPLCSALP